MVIPRGVQEEERQRIKEVWQKRRRFRQRRVRPRSCNWNRRSSVNFSECPSPRRLPRRLRRNRTYHSRSNSIRRRLYGARPVLCNQDSEWASKTSRKRHCHSELSIIKWQIKRINTLQHLLPPRSWHEPILRQEVIEVRWSDTQRLPSRPKG